MSLETLRRSYRKKNRVNIAVYRALKHYNLLCGQNVELLVIKPGGTFSYQ
jgi:hypothetical protein